MLCSRVFCFWQVQTLFNSVKKEYSNARELEQNFSRKYSENKLKLEELTESLQHVSILYLFIFRPYFIWERKIFKSNGFFTKFAKHQFYI